MRIQDEEKDYEKVSGHDPIHKTPHTDTPEERAAKEREKEKGAPVQATK